MRIEALDGPAGALVTDLPADLTALSADDAAALRCAFDEFGLLVLRGRPMSVEEQMAVCSNLGTIIDQAANGRSWFNITNQGGGYDGKLCFHADFSNMEGLLTGASLYASALPDGPTATIFAHTGNAYTELPDALRSRIAGSQSVHSSRQSTEGTAETPVRHSLGTACDPRVEHPIEFTHPQTGATLLFVSDLQTERVVGLDDDASLALLDELADWIQQDRFVYRHQWQLNDLVVWDQIVMQHSRPSESVQGERTLRRVSFTHPRYAQECQAFFTALDGAAGKSGSQKTVM